MKQKHPTIKELMEDRKTRDAYLGLGIESKYFYSPIGVLVAKFSLLLNITANQLTYTWFLLGFVGMLMFIEGSYLFSIIGIIIFHMAMVFDYADGIVARYKKTISRRGMFLENILHRFTPITCLIIGATFFTYYQTSNIIIFLLGFSIVVSNLISISIFSEKIHLFVKTKSFISIKKNKIIPSNNLSLLKKIHNTTKQIFSAQILIITATFALIFNRLDLFLWFYGITYPIMMFSLLVFEIRRGDEWIGGYWE